MSFLMRQVAHCDICGHEWLTAKVPSHCAKCKSRKWNIAMPDHLDSMKALAKVHAARANMLLGHNPKTCRIYKCGMCAASKVEQK